MNPIIAHYKNGNKHYEEYFNDLDKYHNESGPAYILYYENGNKEIEEYFINGKYHNVKGPAYITYSKYGEIENKYYYLNDEIIDIHSDEEFQKHIKRLNIS